MFEISPYPIRSYDGSKPPLRRATAWIIMALFVIGSVAVLWLAGFIATYKEPCPSGFYNRGMCMHQGPGGRLLT